jgi:hypothetical protein
MMRTPDELREELEKFAQWLEILSRADPDDRQTISDITAAFSYLLLSYQKLSRELIEQRERGKFASK